MAVLSLWGAGVKTRMRFSTASIRTIVATHAGASSRSRPPLYLCRSILSQLSAVVLRRDDLALWYLDAIHGTGVSRLPADSFGGVPRVCGFRVGSRLLDLHVIWWSCSRPLAASHAPDYHTESQHAACIRAGRSRLHSRRRSLAHHRPGFLLGCRKCLRRTGPPSRSYWRWSNDRCSPMPSR